MSTIVKPHISYAIQGAFLDTYYELKYGLNEKLYARALELALAERGLSVEREFPIKVVFRGRQIGFHRLDMLVERRVIVEIKASEVLARAAFQQLRCYVSASRLQLGILLHYGPEPAFYRELLGYRRDRKTIRGISLLSSVSSPAVRDPEEAEVDQPR
jgi:GxxExxY protein